MRIAFLHTDLRVYWPTRLRAFHEFANVRGWDLRVLELAGKGSPYSFAEHESGLRDWWECLFPATGPEEIANRAARRAFMHRLDAIKPDLVIACGGIAYSSGAAALAWTARNRRPLVLLDDARRRDVPRSPWVNGLKKRFYKQADAVMVPSPAFLEDYLSWGFRENQVFYSLNVVDNGFWRKHAKSVADGKSDSSTSRKPPRPGQFFLGVGRQVEKKNWMALLEAYRKYIDQAKGAHWSLVLVGDGPERDPLSAYAKRHQLTRVQILPFLKPADLAQYYASAGALVLPSKHGETWGLVVNEAMACGCPVLVSRQCGCASTLVNEGVNGWTFDPNSIAEIESRLEMISSLPNEARRGMGDASREIIGQWGLDRFCHGLGDAASFALSRQRSPKMPLADRLLVSLWTGRYRPV